MGEQSDETHKHLPTSSFPHFVETFFLSPLQKKEKRKIVRFFFFFEFFWKEFGSGGRRKKTRGVCVGDKDRISVIKLFYQAVLGCFTRPTSAVNHGSTGTAVSTYVFMSYSCDAELKKAPSVSS